MASVCFYFEVHQPWRLAPYGPERSDPFCFDDAVNREILEKVAAKCYRPATTRLLELARRHGGRFRMSFSITGTLIRQLEAWAPDVLDIFRELIDTGACEMIGETSHHSLAFLFSRDEFDAQVAEHEALMKRVFGVRASVFRNTELIYSNDLAAHLAATGRWKATICEGVDRLLGFRSPAYVYAPPAPTTPAGELARTPLRLLLKNYSLSDDIAFRFSNQAWPHWPLTADRFVEWVDSINGNGYLCNLFMDYETLGEHQWEETGIFDFIEALPDHLGAVNPGENDFVTVSEAIERYEPVGVYDVPEPISWADQERDLTAWLGNGMQDEAARALYALERPVKDAHERGDEHVLEDWRRLTTSDHLYYMCTKFWSDGDVHKYFSHYRSPYDAFVNFMNVVDAMRRRLGA